MLEVLQSLLRMKNKPVIGVILNLPGSKRWETTLLKVDETGIVGLLEDGAFGMWPWTGIARVDLDPNDGKAAGL